MDDFASFVIISYWVLLFAAAGVYRVRAGLGLWHGLRVFGPGGVGLDWLALTMVKLLGWPIVLIAWLTRGRPEPRIVFNHKAVARQAQPA